MLRQDQLQRWDAAQYVDFLRLQGASPDLTRTAEQYSAKAGVWGRLGREAILWSKIIHDRLPGGLAKRLADRDEGLKTVHFGLIALLVSARDEPPETTITSNDVTIHIFKERHAATVTGSTASYSLRTLRDAVPGQGITVTVFEGSGHTDLLSMPPLAAKGHLDALSTALGVTVPDSVLKLMG